jgi:hypothetical protein
MTILTKQQIRGYKLFTSEEIDLLASLVDGIEKREKIHD